MVIINIYIYISINLLIYPLIYLYGYHLRYYHFNILQAFWEPIGVLSTSSQTRIKRLLQSIISLSYVLFKWPVSLKFSEITMFAG